MVEGICYTFEWDILFNYNESSIKTIDCLGRQDGHFARAGAHSVQTIAH